MQDTGGMAMAILRIFQKVVFLSRTTTYTRKTKSYICPYLPRGMAKKQHMQDEKQAEKSYICPSAVIDLSVKTVDLSRTSTIHGKGTRKFMAKVVFLSMPSRRPDTNITQDRRNEESSHFVWATLLWNAYICPLRSKRRKDENSTTPEICCKNSSQENRTCPSYLPHHCGPEGSKKQPKTEISLKSGRKEECCAGSSQNSRQ